LANENEMTKARLLERIGMSWEELLVLLNSLDEASMSRIDPASGWAVKDHLAHLAAWERGIAYLLKRRPRAEGMGITAEQWVDLTMDEINEELYRTGKDRSAAGALATFREAHHELLDALTVLDDADLLRDYSAYDEKEPYSGRPIVGWIIGNTYEHYDEHLGYIRAGLAG
jgi:hypothetical protein